MKWRSPSPVEAAISLVRPLLDCTKNELLAYARENRIRFRNDATNLVPDVLRNRLRLELLPLLREQYQPGLDQAVLRLMELVGAEAECAAEQARAFRAGRDDVSGKRIPAPAAQFTALPVAIQRRVLWQELVALGVPPDFELVEQLRAAPGKKMSAGAGFVARDAAGKVARPEPELLEEFQTTTYPVKLAGQRGGVQFGGRRFNWRLETVDRFLLPPKPKPGEAVRECFDADRIGGEMILRHWQPGDRFQPIGRKAAVKLQDLFVNAKIPAARRRELVLAVTAAGQIFWVEGLRIGEACKLTPATRRKLVWRPARTP